MGTKLIFPGFTNRLSVCLSLCPFLKRETRLRYCRQGEKLKIYLHIQKAVKNCIEMPKSVFLDKIVTSMHRPRRDGSTGFVSTTCFPDLSHTQITTNYCPQPTTACTPLGNMTLKFRIEAHRETRSAQRPVSEFMRRPKFFRRAHNVFCK